MCGCVLLQMTLPQSREPLFLVSSPMQPDSITLVAIGKKMW